MPSTHYISGIDPSSICSQDFDEDGHADLVTANIGSDDVSILFGNGDGSFQGTVRYGVGRAPRSICSDDFDGDGYRDLAVANGTSHDVSILLGCGSGYSFMPSVEYDISSESFDPYSICSNDFDEDGDIDLAIALNLASEVMILSNRGDGKFDIFWRVLSTTSKSKFICSDDFDEDGLYDLAVAGLNNVAIHIGYGNNIFQSAVEYSVVSNATCVCPSDFNEDGHIDLAVSVHDADEVAILLGSGDGTFAPAVYYGAGDCPYSVCADDFDGDGHVDLSTANACSDDVSVLLGSGVGTFAPAINNDAGASSPHWICSDDYNDDRIIDLAVANESSGLVSIMLGNGDGTFALQGHYFAGYSPFFILSDDFNDDGHHDLAVANDCFYDISILYNLSDVITGEVSDRIPRFQSRLSNHPNPFNPVTTVSFSIPAAGRVNISIYDAAGRLVRVLVERDCEPGVFEAVWNGRNNSGMPVSSGIYFARMTVNNFTEVRKLVLLR